MVLPLAWCPSCATCRRITVGTASGQLQFLNVLLLRMPPFLGLSATTKLPSALNYQHTCHGESLVVWQVNSWTARKPKMASSFHPLPGSTLPRSIRISQDHRPCDLSPSHPPSNLHCVELRDGARFIFFFPSLFHAHIKQGPPRV